MQNFRLLISITAIHRPVLSMLIRMILKKNTTLKKAGSSDTYQLSETKQLKGVYNINRGYAVFRQVQILCESDDYYIVQSGNDYGLSNYDHIALTGKDVHEGDVIS